MSIYLYSIGCEGCTGNQALMRIQSRCKKRGIDFQERRTILWERYEQEASKIMKLNPGLKLPFFYNEGTGAVLEGNSFTPVEEIDKLIAG